MQDEDDRQLFFKSQIMNKCLSGLSSTKARLSLCLTQILLLPNKCCSHSPTPQVWCDEDHIAFTVGKWRRGGTHVQQLDIANMLGISWGGDDDGAGETKMCVKFTWQPEQLIVVMFESGITSTTRKKTTKKKKRKKRNEMKRCSLTSTLKNRHTNINKGEAESCPWETFRETFLKLK